MRRVFTIILNYNNFADSRECIESLNKILLPQNYSNRIILVDNNSSDGSGRKLKNLFGDSIIYIESDDNGGYAAGNNIGIKYAKEAGAEYICVLNNDTVILEDFFSPCIDYIVEHNDVAFISPAIEDYSSNKVQSTGGDIFFRRGEVTVKNSGKDKSKLPSVIESDYIGGACMLFKADIIDRLGYIPENYFLFFEETEWCWKAKELEMHNVCLSCVSIKHKGSASIDSVLGLHAYMMERNRIVFLKRNAPNLFVYYCAYLFLFLKYVKNGLFVNKDYFHYIEYMKDGRKNEVDERFPFVQIKE